MCLEYYVDIFDRVMDEVNIFLILSKDLRLLDLATPLSANRDGGPPTNLALDTF